jgi:hypothetical protein
MLKRNLLVLGTTIAIGCSLLVACEQGVGTGDGTDTGTGINTARTQAVIGHGYDVSAHYAFSEDIKAAILDHDALIAANLINQDLNACRSLCTTVSGTSITSYQKDLAGSASIGVTVGVPEAASFSTEVGVRFKENYYRNSSYAFASSTTRVTKDAYFVDRGMDPAALQAYLSAGFTADVKRLSGVDLITKYGTHVMLGGLWGARLDHNFTAQKKAGKDGSSIGQYVKVSAEGTIQGVTLGANVAEDTEQSFLSEFETTNTYSSTSAYGGKPEYAKFVLDSGMYDKWIESIDAMPVWIDYYTDTLQPIYLFIADTTKQAEVKSAVSTYLEGKKITVTNTTKQRKTLNLTGSKALFGFTKLLDNKNDGDIGSAPGKNTFYELVITLTTESSKVKADAKLTVWEKNGSFNTTYTGTLPEPFEFTSDKTISDIDCVKLWTFTGNYTTQVRTETIDLTGNNACPFVTKLEICLDDGIYDNERIGFACDFKIPIVYWE